MLSRARRLILRIPAALILAFSVLLPAVAPVHAADKLILNVGTLQDLDSMNPFQAVYVVSYEAFTLNYDLLVNFGANTEPVPGFAASWTVSPDGRIYTFKTRPGAKWSDGQPATAKDAAWTYTFMLKNPKHVTGLGYLDAYLSDVSMVSAVATDDTTLVVTLKEPNPRVLQAYIPILPEHIWGNVTYAQVAKGFSNSPTPGKPVVGSGPYQAVEWKTGEFARFVKNPYYWGPTGAADEVVIHFFKQADTMVQALKTGAIDYARSVNADQLNQLKSEPNIVTVAGTANGFTQLNFNCYSKPIPGGGASTKALRDPAFRDALGYAIDKDLLVKRVLGGYGVPGNTVVPPFQTAWHVDPPADQLRVFSIQKAGDLLTAAGYPLVNGARMDKEGKPIKLRLYAPDDDPSYAKSGEFIAAWFGQLGIEVTAQVLDGDTLGSKELPPEADGKAEFDMVIWGWGGDVDPSSLLKINTTDQIGGSSDSFWSNPTYDDLYVRQNLEQDPAKRKDLMAQMQLLMYKEAPYHILYYDSDLVAYRTDKFKGWSNQPANSVPLFGYGSYDYTLLTDAKAVPTPGPTAQPGASAVPSASAAPGAPSAAPSTAPTTPAGSSGGVSLPLTLGVIGLLVVIAIGIFFLRRRDTSVEDE
jgi:peptide/nickel transport system substrate-binding protein